MIATIRMSEDLVKTHFRTLASDCAGLEPDPGGVCRRSPAIATKCLLLATRPAEKTAQSEQWERSERQRQEKLLRVTSLLWS